MRFATGVFAALAVCFVTSAHSAERQVLRGHVPTAIANLKAIDDLPATNELRLAIALPLRNQEELSDLLEQMYDPKSPVFRHYLTPEQFTERFGPTKEDYQAVMEFAKAQGLNIINTHRNRGLLDVSGSVAKVEKAFHTHLHRYQHPSEARTFYAPDAEPSVDASVPILEVKGLDDYDIPRPNSHFRANSKTATPNMGSGPGGTFMGNDFRRAYIQYVPSTGAGQKVGLLEFDGYYTNDPVLYASMAGLTNTLPITNVTVDSSVVLPGPANGEVSLDIEMGMAMARGAQIIVYECSNNVPTGVVDILNRMANDNLAEQLSSSWQYGTGPAMDQAYQQMALQGQTYFNSSGDLGAYSGKVTTPSYDPYITIVGGTSMTTDASGSRTSEVAWSWADEGIGTAATGGGVSTVWGIPTWQQGVDMSANGGSTTMRNLPDVSMVAENVEVVVDNGQYQTAAGTSVSTPLWAGFMALANQQAAAGGKQSFGFINPLIYAIGQSIYYGAVFNDIGAGDNTNSTSPTNFFAVPGYDLCTGWGTPNSSLIYEMLNYQFSLPTGWTLQSISNETWSGVATSGDGTVFVAVDSSGVHPINISTSFGATWRTYGPNTDWEGIACSADGTKMAAAPWDAPIFTSSNSGVAWIAADTPFYSWHSMASSGDGTKLATQAFWEDVIAISTNSGLSWFTNTVPGGLGKEPVAWSSDGTVLITARGDNSVYVSTNNGVTWLTNTLSLVNLSSVAASANGSTLFAVGTSQIYTSTNLGVTWTPTTASSQTWTSIACSADGGRIVAAGEGIIPASSDGGLSWSMVTPNPPPTLPPLGDWRCVACSSDGSRWITANQYFVYIGFFTLPLAILTHPQDQTAECGSNITFTVQTSGASPSGYQWYYGSKPLSDGAGVSGSKTASLALSTVSLSQSGVYTLSVVNSYGSTNSVGATFSIQLPTLPGLNSLTVQGNGSVTGTVNGFAGPTQIESSTNLVNWVLVTNII